MAVAAALASVIAGCAASAPSAQPADLVVATPWRAGERLEYRLRNSAGEEVGRGVLAAAVEGERLVLQQVYTGTRHADGGEPVRDEIALTVDAKTLRPLQGARTTAGGSSADRATRTTWTYRAEGERLGVVTRVAREGERAEEEAFTVRGQAYDNESSLWLWRGIAFAEEYGATYTSVNALDRSQQTVTLRVPQQERVEVPAGTFDTWRILLRTGRAARTAWISITPPHEVVRWDNGDLIFELDSRP